MEKPETISYYDHEAQIARSEINARRWAFAALLTFAALILTNLSWALYESQYQGIAITETEQDGSGINIIGTGGVNYGATDKDGEDKGQKRRDP